MRTKWMVLTLAILAVALIPAAYADCGCENAKAEETVAVEASSCGGSGGEAHAGCSGDCGGHSSGSGCSGECAATEVAKMVQGAEGGCEASMASLIAMAQKSTDAETVALANKAKQGDEQSQTALIALAKDWAKTEGPHPTMAQLAERAAHGCQHSTEALIAMAKKSDNPEEVALANRAAGGCKHSTDELIAMAQSSSSTDTETN